MTDERKKHMVSKEEISKVLTKAEEINPYKIIGVSETYSHYNQGWCDAINYIASMLGVDY